MKKNGKNNICTICQKIYYIRADRAEASKYCGRECWYKRRILKECEHCHEKITSYHGNKYCSRDCSKKAMVGEKSSSWKDGKSLERDRARNGTQLKKWKKQIYERDNHTCQQCGIQKFLHAHHKIEWAKDETKRFDLDNGITLCVDCHSTVHGRRIGKLTTS